MKVSFRKEIIQAEEKSYLPMEIPMRDYGNWIKRAIKMVCTSMATEIGISIIFFFRYLSPSYIDQVKFIQI